MPTYHRPTSLSDACGLLADLGTEALPLAGGTDLVVDIRRGVKCPHHLVSLRDVAELRGIRQAGDLLEIGALCTPSEIGTSAILRAARPELTEAVRIFGTPQIRNRATVGGNLCTAASCGDLSPLLLALRATVVVANSKGIREISLDEFFQGVRATVLSPGEILVKILLPSRRSREGARYEAFGLRAAAFITVAGVAAAVTLAGKVCRQARVVLSAVAPTPLLVPGAAETLVGRDLNEEVIRAAGRIARQEAAPISDLRGSAEHRRDLVEVLTRRALLAARERAHENDH